MLRPLVIGTGVMLWGILPLTASTQERDSLASTLALRLAAVPAVTGYERSLVDTVLRLLPGAGRDRAGNARLTLGVGSPKRLVVCPLDEPGYVIGNVRPDGYLTLRRVPGKAPPSFDQQLEGHRVTIQGTRGQVPGVVAVRSIHLTRGRPLPPEAPFTVDDAYVDVGAVSPEEVAGIGVRILAPVTLTKLVHSYGGGLLAAPVVGRRAACAALLSAARQQATKATPRAATMVAFVVEQELGKRGLGTLANAFGPFEEALIVDGRRGTRGELQRGLDADVSGRWSGLGRVTRWWLPVSYEGTPVETVALTDVESLREALIGWIGGDT
jgi:putative aminopeptidase FrvX